MSFTLTPATPPNVDGKFCFIDGNFLDAAIRKLQEAILLDEIVTIDRSKVLPRNMFRYYWYDSLPAQKPSEDDAAFGARFAEKRQLLEEIANFKNVIVRDGYSKWQKGRGQHQKAVDVLLAVDALQHAHNGSMTEFHLVAGDIDFLPVVDALVMNGVRVVIHKLEYGGQVSDALLRSADFDLPIPAMALSAAFGERGRFSRTRKPIRTLEALTKIDADLFQKDDMYFLEWGHRDDQLASVFQGKNPDVLRRVAALKIYER